MVKQVLQPFYDSCSMATVDKPQQWNVAKEITDRGSMLFSNIQIVHHTYGKHKAEEECNRMSKHNQY